MDIINKIKKGNELYSLGGVYVGMEEPQGENRLPLWICPQGYESEPSYVYNSYIQVKVGSTYYYKYYFAMFDENHHVIIKTSPSNQLYSTSNEATNAMKADIDFMGNSVYIYSPVCETTVSNDDSTDIERVYLISDFKFFDAKPNTNYSWHTAFRSSSSWNKVSVNDTGSIYWYDKDLNFISNETLTYSQEDYDNNIQYKPFTQSPTNAKYYLFAGKFAGDYHDSDHYHCVKQYSSENNTPGIYVLNDNNNEYYREM